MTTEAKWIWHGGTHAPNTWMRFRRKISLVDTPDQATVRIAVDSKYWLWINGDIVVREGQLKRGPTPEDTYCDEVDITPHLHAGENDIAVLVWYWGVDGSSHLSSGSGGLFFDAKIDELNIGTNSSWKASRHPGFQPSIIKPIRPGTIILSEWDVWYDARLVEESDWFALGFEDDCWDFAREYGGEGAEPWRKLVKRPIPLWKDSQLLPYENASDIALSRRSTGDQVRAVLPANIQVTPYFKVNAPAGQTLTVRVERDWKTTQYTTRDGVQEFEVPAWGNGHYVTYTVPEDVEILDLAYRQTGYPIDVQGEFECDDPDLNLLWQKSWRTASVCMRDGYMDCPDRERSQWPNDAVNMIDQTLYVFDRGSDLLTKKLFAEMLGWKTQSGILWGAVPCGRFRGAYRELYSITLSALGPGVGGYYLQTGDVPNLAALYPAVRDYLLDHYEMDAKILLHPRCSWTTEWGAGTSNWHDWGDQNNLDHRLLDNLWFYYALSTARSLAKDLGDSEGYARLVERTTLFEICFNDLFWRDDHYRSWDYNGLPDDRGNALAVVTGLADEAKWSALGRVLVASQFASIYMEKYVIEALYILGQPDDAKSRIKTRMAHALQSTYTTLPEAFGEDSNHGWSGWPAYIAGRYIAGISPTAPGYARYRVAPHLGSLRHVVCTVPTVKGEIRVRIDQEADSMRIRLSAPERTIGTVVIWKKSPDHPARALVGVSSGTVRLAGEDSHAAWFEVSDGDWLFEASYA